MRLNRRTVLTRARRARLFISPGRASWWTRFARLPSCLSPRRAVGRSRLRRGDSRAAVRSNQSPEIGTKPTIAILPFLNQSDDPAREYFADGLTQDIISALGRFSELTVMSWNAVSPYRGKPGSPGEIARDLGVRYQVEGSVRQTGDRVRVSAQLVDTDGRVLWSARFDEALADVFALQDKITTQIAGALAIQVAQVEQRRASDSRPKVSKPTTTSCAPGRHCSARRARTTWRHARSSGMRSSSTRTMPPRIPDWPILIM